MPKTKNAYVRYLIIHSQIKRNRYRYGFPTLADLREELEFQGYGVSSSTIEKDLSFLKYERGAPIEYDRIQRCYRYAEDWEFDIPLSPDDVRMIRMLVHKLEIFGEAEEFRMLQESIDRLTNQFDLMDQYPNDKIDKYILFEYTKGFSGKHMLSQIYEAIFDRKEICFTHCRFESDQPTRRVLQPYILKEHRNRWYVIGKEDGVPKIFGLDRISSLEVTDTVFIQDPAFYDEIFRVLYDSVGVFAFGVKSEDVVLRFTGDEAPYIRSLPLHRSQKIIDDSLTEGLTVEIHVKVTPEFIKDCILRFGDSVRVVSPVHLADNVRDIHAKALERYE